MTRPSAPIRLVIDGVPREVDVDPRMPLLLVLRDVLGLTGPQFGCGTESCGACKVIIGSSARTSCRLPVGEVGDAPITTIAGLAEDGELHPVQKAFLAEQALQCGFCINGMVMEAAALVMQQHPSEERIRDALAGNLCRCGTHTRIVRAVRVAAREIWED